MYSVHVHLCVHPIHINSREFTSSKIIVSGLLNMHVHVMNFMMRVYCITITHDGKDNPYMYFA